MASTSLRVKIVAIGETEVIGEKGFKKRTLEGIIEGEHPQSFQFEFTQDKVALLDNVLEETYATIHYNLRSRKVTEDKDGMPYDKPLFFVSLNGWKIE